MSKAFELISESLNELIQDFEETGGKNLKRETLTLEVEKNLSEQKFATQHDEKFLIEQLQ